MRVLNLNKRMFKYALYTGNLEPLKDAEGNLTGEYSMGYSEPKAAYANISAATGDTSDEAFGANVSYDRVICAETDFGMDEQTRLWVDNLDAPTHDYIVKRVARSLNSVLIAIERVTTNAAP